MASNIPWSTSVSDIIGGIRFVRVFLPEFYDVFTNPDNGRRQETVESRLKVRREKGP